MLLHSFVVLVTLSTAAVGLPSIRRGSGGCPFIFNENGVPSLDDIKKFADGGAKPLDMPSLAVAASLVLKSPKFVAGLFLNQDGKENGETWPIPANAILLPDIEGESCRESGITAAGNLRDSSDKHFNLVVDFPGGSEQWGPVYTGDELKAADTSDNSAWVFLFQATMLRCAQTDLQSGTGADGGQWKNTRDGGEDKQMFNPEFVLQEGQNLDRMLFLATNKETSQTAIEDIQDSELKAVLDSMSKSPVLVIPKADTHNILASDRIWIGMGPAEKQQGMWTFYNPVERKTRTASLAQLREGIVQDIIYINDHSSLADST